MELENSIGFASGKLFDGCVVHGAGPRSIPDLVVTLKQVTGFKDSRGRPWFSR